MITHESVQVWLDQYVAAWKALDADQIRALFGENARYCYTPFEESLALVGREEIVRAWLEDFDDAPGTYDAKYYPVVIEGNVAVTNGRTHYAAIGAIAEAVFDNIFILTFDDDGRCVDFREWYMMPRR